MDEATLEYYEKNAAVMRQATMQPRQACPLSSRLSSSGGALGRVASIINTDRKVATYKLALIRALCDIAMMSWASAAWESGGVVSVPLAMVAERWVRYYWPLMRAGSGGGERGREKAGRGEAGAPTVIFPQINGEGRGGKPIAFRSILTELVDECRPLGGLTAFTRMQADGRLPSTVQKLYARALRTIGAAIVRGPVQFAGNARGPPSSHSSRGRSGEAASWFVGTSGGSLHSWGTGYGTPLSCGGPR